LHDIVWEWRDNYDKKHDPEEYFQLLTEALDAYLLEFADDPEAVAVIKRIKGVSGKPSTICTAIIQAAKRTGRVTCVHRRHSRIRIDLFSMM
jgi:hypothetical protein